jgi:RNA polymerase primary sigma factor
MTADSLNMYLKEIRQFPLLSIEEERELIDRIGRGDMSARDRLVESNLRLVVSIAKKYQNNGLTLMDLIQEANIGLLIAVEKFEPERGYRFSTYASWWIKQTISRALDNKSKLIRLPAYVVEGVNKMKNVERALTITLGREPTLEEVAKEMGLDEAKVKKLRESSKEISSLDVTVGDDDEATMGELIADTSSLTPEESMENQTRTEVLDTILGTLEDREGDVIKYRYGLMDGEPRTLEEVGQIFGLTKERIRQIEAKALRKLRNPFRAKLLRETFDF